MYRGDVVGTGAEEVQPDGVQGPLREAGGVDDATQVAGHQDDVARLDRNVGPGADRNAHVCLGQRRGVVDAIADEGDLLALAVQALDLRRLLVGQDIGQHPVDTGLARGGVGGRPTVTGQYGDLEAEPAQRLHSLAAAVLEWVGYGDDRGELTVYGGVEWRLRLNGQRRGARRSLAEIDPQAPNIAVGADLDRMPLLPPPRRRSLLCGLILTLVLPAAADQTQFSNCNAERDARVRRNRRMTCWLRSSRPRRCA